MGFWLTSQSLGMCVQLNRAPSPGGTSWCPLARGDSGSVSRDEAPLAAHPAGVGTMGTGTAQDVSQHPAEFLRSASHTHTHTHISSQQWAYPEPEKIPCLQLPTHPHSLVKIVTNTVISNIYPVINANNGSNIPFRDHLSSSKGCN